MQEMKKEADKVLPSDLIRIILKRTGYEEALESEGTDEAKDRLDNIGE